MPDKLIDELASNYEQSLGQLQKLALLDGVLLEGIELTTTPALIPHKLKRKYRGLILVKGHEGGSGSGSGASSSVTTSYGTIYRWDGTAVTGFTDIGAGSGASLSLSTQTGGNPEPAIQIDTPAGSGTTLYGWWIDGILCPTEYWMHAVVDTASDADMDCGVLFHGVDQDKYFFYGKIGNTATSVFLRNNNNAMATRGSTVTIATEAATNDLSYIQLTASGILPTASTDPGLRGHIGGPNFVPTSAAQIVNIADWGTWDAGWQTAETGWRVGIAALHRAAGAFAAGTFKISQLAVGAHPAGANSTSNYATAFYTSQASGITEDVTSTDFDRSRFIRLSAASSQTVSLWVF